MTCCCNQTETPRRRRGLFGSIFNVMLVYVVLVVAGGTLINTGNPMAIEIGEIIHLVTFIDPLQAWVYGLGLSPLASGLDLLQGGIPLDWAGRYV